jgi:EmrB/QacA subfamily drug resistance transporter
VISRQTIILLVVSSSIFFEALDIAIINLAIPLIQKDFLLTSDTVQWLQTLYVLFYGGLLIMGGKLADLAGRKKVFMAGSAVFLITSLGAGLSNSFEVLALCRAFQGLGAALVMPSAMSIITNTFTETTARHKAIGIFGSFAAIGSGSGLSIGGLIATYWGWPWVFFINVPVIVIALILAQIYIVPDGTHKPKAKADILSGIVLTLTIVQFTYLIHELKNIQHKPVLLILLIIGIAAGLKIFLTRNLNRPNPLIDFSLLKSSSLVTGNSTVLMMGAFFTSYLFLISLIMQTQMNYTAANAGLILFPFSILSAIVSKSMLPILLKRISMKQAGIVGMTLMTCGGFFLLLSMLWQYNLVLLLMSVACVTGTGIAVCFMSLTVIALEDISEQHHGLASSLTNTCFFIGGGIGMAILGFVMQLTEASQDFTMPLIVLTLYALAGTVWLIFRYRQKHMPLISQP